MGIVHLAEVRGPGGFEKLVVVKELKAELADDAVYTAMFLDEARLAARLSHRHIVQTNEVGCENGRYFMALELLEGGSLHQIRAKLGLRAIPTNVGVRVLVAVLDALHHAHEQTDADGAPLGVVHRDVSPQNVFLTFDGGVKLIDFGVAKSKDRAGAAVTRVGVVKGSVPYMSPDHVDGTAIDRRADVFAVGILLRELLTGERLWGDADDLTILKRLIVRDLPEFPASATELPRALRSIVDRAMAARRQDRFATAAAMRDALEAYLVEHDPRGSLDDLGEWLGENLAAERRAFAAMVKKARAKIAGAAATRADLWLPSCELRTRYSGPPALPMLAPPLPASASANAASGGRARWFAGTTVLLAALAVAALGAARARPDSTLSPSSVATTTDSFGADHSPRLVDGDVKVAIDTSAVSEAATATGAAGSAPDVTVDPDVFASDPSATHAASLPAAVLREALPPNPYAE
jgi:serine/threonine-protein kinase